MPTVVEERQPRYLSDTVGTLVDADDERGFLALADAALAVLRDEFARNAPPAVIARIAVWRLLGGSDNDLPWDAATPPSDRPEVCGAIHPEHPVTRCRQPDGHRGEHATARRDVTWDNAYLSTPVPAGDRAGLDVEQLAEAMAGSWEGGPDRDQPLDEWLWGWARSIAAEYALRAALSPLTPPEPEREP
jgi:hypothetical protein